MRRARGQCRQARGASGARRPVPQLAERAIPTFDRNRQARDEHRDNQRRQRKRQPHAAHVQRNFRVHHLRGEQLVARHEEERRVAAYR